MKKRSLLRRGLLAGAVLVGTGGGALVLAAPQAGASNIEISAAGSFTTYVMMHNLFPLSLNDLDPGQKTTHQHILPTALDCKTGVYYTTAYYTAHSLGTAPGAPNGSGAGRTALHAEEALAATDLDNKSCLDFSRSSGPPEPGTNTVSTNFDYYAYALDGVAPMVGSNAGGSRANPPILTLTQMKGIYLCKATYTNWKDITGATFAKTGGVSNQQGKTDPIVRFWPQSGSGTRSVYGNILGFTPENLTLTTSTYHSKCTSKPLTKITVSGTSKTVEENSEEGLIYQDQKTPTNYTVKDDVYIYSSGKFESQWNTTTHYNSTHKSNVTTATTGNFFAKTLLLAQMKNRNPTTTAHPTQPFANYTSQTGTFTQNANRGAYGINTSVVKEANEWYSHIASTGTGATASTATVPGVRYVFNVADTALPTYSEVKMMVGFDNQKKKVLTVFDNETKTYVGATSALCNGDDASTIVASGFVPLNNGTTAPATSDLAGTTCREFPGKHFPGRVGQTKSWTYNAFVQTT